jgi:hypothetical protein
VRNREKEATSFRTRGGAEGEETRQRERKRKQRDSGKKREGERKNQRDRERKIGRERGKSGERKREKRKKITNPSLLGGTSWKWGTLSHEAAKSRGAANCAHSTSKLDYTVVELAMSGSSEI